MAPLDGYSSLSMQPVCCTPWCSIDTSSVVPPVRQTVHEL